MLSARAWLALMCFSAVCHAGPQDFQIKAAYLINFTRYINWPTPPNHLLCIVGADDVADWMEKNQSKSGRAVKRLAQMREVESCTLLYLGQDSSQIAAWLAAVKDHAVLTVSEQGGFLQKGGMINLVMQNNALRFSVNLEPAKEVQLKFSSRMLALAEKVEGGGQ